MSDKIETHGKVDQQEPSTLDKLWGYELARYGTADENTYVEQLESMSRTDLEHHTRRLGLPVLESTARLKERLVVEFRNFNLLQTKPVGHPVNVVNAARKDIDPEALKVLQQGR